MAQIARRAGLRDIFFGETAKGNGKGGKGETLTRAAAERTRPDTLVFLAVLALLPILAAPALASALLLLELLPIALLAVALFVAGRLAAMVLAADFFAATVFLPGLAAVLTRALLAGVLASGFAADDADPLVLTAVFLREPAARLARLPVPLPDLLSAMGVSTTIRRHHARECFNCKRDG